MASSDCPTLLFTPLNAVRDVLHEELHGGNLDAVLDVLHEELHGGNLNAVLDAILYALQTRIASRSRKTHRWLMVKPHPL